MMKLEMRTKIRNYFLVGREIRLYRLSDNIIEIRIRTDIIF